jgi:hypothetical protein
MRCAARLSVILTVLASVGATAACGRKLGPSDIPILTTETFTGTIVPLGTSHHAFTVYYSVNFTDATMTLTSLTTVSSGSVPAITIGLAFGNLNGGVCTRAPSYTRVAISVNQALPTVDQPFSPGVFCVQIFDNPDSPTVTEPLNYSLTVSHN